MKIDEGQRRLSRILESDDGSTKILGALQNTLEAIAIEVLHAFAECSIVEYEHTAPPHIVYWLTKG